MPVEPLPVKPVDNGSKYRGKQSYTKSGKKCMKWSSQNPHKHDRTPAKFPNAGLGFQTQTRSSRYTGGDFEMLRSGQKGKPGWRMATRKDLESDADLKNRVVSAIGHWGIIKLGNGGKLDGRGYGANIHNSHGAECCAKTLWKSGTISNDVGSNDHNYCRNPDGEKGIWCYTTDRNTRWEHCDPNAPVRVPTPTCKPS